MRQKHLLVVLGVAIVGLAIALLLMMRSSPAGGPEPPASADPTAPATTPGTTAPMPRPPTPKVKVDITKPSEHGKGIDLKLAQLTAMLKAPEGKNPCETLWLAVQAEQATAKELGKKSIYLRVAPKDEFMRLCSAIPEAAQPCLAPRFLARNRELCLPLRPPKAQIDALFSVRPELLDEEAQDLERQLAGVGLDGGSSTSSAPPANMK
jgi:hypothetical protein